MSAVDTAWLRMDRAHNLMMISGVLMFREKLSLARLKKVITQRFLVFRRFSQRPVETATGASPRRPAAAKKRAAKKATGKTRAAKK